MDKSEWLQDALYATNETLSQEQAHSERLKRDLIDMYNEFSSACLSGESPDFESMIAILKRHKVKVNDEFRIEEVGE
jgi:hypothetical protein